MKRIALAFFLSMIALGSFGAGPAAADDTCKAKAMDKNGKPLAGAALASFMKKCTTDTCTTTAVDKNGKPLAGAAKTSFMKKCETDQSS